MIIEQLYLISKESLFILSSIGDKVKKKKRTRINRHGWEIKRLVKLHQVKGHVRMVHFKKL